MNCQVLPASGDMKTPRPSTTSLRGLPSPVPTHTRFGFEGASATAPIDDVGWSLKTASHESPPSIVFHTPPAAAPSEYTLRSPGTPTTAATRPPATEGPRLRNLRLLSESAPPTGDRSVGCFCFTLPRPCPAAGRARAKYKSAL